MRAVDIIIKKRDQEQLTKLEIDFFVEGFTKGEIPDYQVSAWAMAILLNGMTEQETTELTLAMANSGDMLNLSSIAPIVADKHSTGGVGDKTSLVVAPVVAACGLLVGKMSGRGLGFSGGTLDKLESIPGYRVNLSIDEFMNQLREIGIVLTGQSADLAPADGKLYALRDVTGTVPCIPLIASSVMSKKLAAGANVIVLDVKIGFGAFMTNMADARKLARMMVAIGKLSGRQVRAVLSDMNQPLGEAVGNAMELREAIDTLQGHGPADFHEHCMVIASHLLQMGKKADSLEKGRALAEKILKSGDAWKKFRQLVQAQGGDVSVIDQPQLLPHANLIEQLLTQKSGYLSMVNAKTVAEAAILLGAGRAKKGDPIDYGVGVLAHCKVGDEIKKGQLLFTIHANDKNKLEQAKNILYSAIKIQDTPCEPLPLFYDVIQ
jgi:pyrimidine-nucleoside phosphorylase